MDNIVSVKLDSRYASTLGVWQYDYGQVLRITGPELPPAVEVQFSLDEKSGETLSRVGTTVDGVTEVKIPDELLTNSATSNYRIYAYIYLTDETSGNTKYEITIPVRVRSKPTSPTEDPETDPDLFRETVVAVNTSAERAENAASSATESAASAEETLIEIKRVTDGISEDIENANTANSKLSGMINSAEEKKKELVASTEEAGETKMELDSSINSAGEKQLALDTTVEQANTVDESLKEQIGSAEQIQANVEQIAKNKADISSLNEDLADLKDKKITKFYASNQGETHLADSDNGKIMDMMLYGRSEQNKTIGKNLLKYPYVEATKMSLGVTFMDNKDGSINVSGIGTGVAYYDLYSNRDGKRLTLASGTYKLVVKGRSKCNVFVNNGVNSAKNEGTFTVTDGHNDVWCYIEVPKGLAVGETIYPMIQLASSTDESYEPYTGGKPSPNPDYPQEIKRVVNPVVKVCGKNLWNPIAGGYISNLNGSITASEKSDIATTDFIKTNGKDITVIARNFSLAIEYAFAYRIGFYDGEKKWIKNVVLSDGNKHNINTFNVTDAEYIRVSAPSGVYDTIQIEKGSEATSYEPYTEQSVQLPYTLNAIPVASGGNVTIDGQQWVCDEVDLVRGVKVQRVKVRELSPDDEWAYRKLASGNNNFQVRILNADVAIDGKPCFCNILPFKNVIWDDSIQNLPKIYANKQEITVSFPPSSEYSSLEAFKHMLTDVKSVIYYILATPIETPLTQEEASAFKQLMTYYPVTNISVTSDQLDGYTVFNYPISMQNGWNYVKQQLNDNRDYIYDMDIQSAEAYVNSEYAVALTELEV